MCCARVSVTRSLMVWGSQGGKEDLELGCEDGTVEARTTRFGCMLSERGPWHEVEAMIASVVSWVQ